MKRFSLILSILLLGIMLVSCGATLKNTSGKDSEPDDPIEQVVHVEQTRKPRYVEVISYGFQYLIFTSNKDDFEANSQVYIQIKDRNSDIVFERVTKANTDGSLNFNFVDKDVFSKEVKIKITAQYPGKLMSEPLVIEYAYFD